MVILILVGAYRSLGGAAPAPGDSSTLLRSLQVQLRSSLDVLSAQLDGAAQVTADSDAARDGRKLGAAVQQTLDRLPRSASLGDDHAAARSLLAAAAEDCAWGWRMVQGPATSPALFAAARVLADHALSCCERAAALLTVPVGGEPRDSA